VKRKIARPIAGPIPRATLAAERTTFRLPTVAALAAAMAVSVAAWPAHAIVGADAGSGDAADANSAADDGGSDDAEAPDAASCPPELGGVQPPVRVHGSGCGCGSEGNENSGVALAASIATVATVLSRRRRR
jgi:MYXO-CTERM domain-containing protein